MLLRLPCSDWLGFSSDSEAVQQKQWLTCGRGGEVSRVSYKMAPYSLFSSLLRYICVCDLILLNSFFSASTAAAAGKGAPEALESQGRWGPGGGGTQ